MHLRRVFLASCLASAAFAAPARAVTFNLVDTGGAAIGTEARAGFEVATRYWSSVLTDDVTITIKIGYSAMGKSTVGYTSYSNEWVDLEDTYTALAADATTTLDTIAVDNLQPLTEVTSGANAGSKQLTFTSNALNETNDGYVDNVTRVDADGSTNNVTLGVTRANAQALGLTTDMDGVTIDKTATAGDVSFNSELKFDFDASDGIDSDSYDFVGVAIHEIGHVLGFSSGVDDYDNYTGTDGGTETSALEKYPVNTTLDLYRYSSEGTIDVSTSDSKKYLSVDGGKTQLLGSSEMATGEIHGDGDQASHWKDVASSEQQTGILDPTVKRGQTLEVTALDLAAYDAIGWDVNVDVLADSSYRMSTADIYTAMTAAVPEPATWLQMLFGFALVGGVVRQRRRVTTVTA